MTKPRMWGPGRERVRLVINGRAYSLELYPSYTLAQALRSELGLTGTKIVCGMGNCGACTVWLDGLPVYACLTLAIDCQERAITTVEGLGQGGELHPVQRAFIAEDAFQCGYCTPGQVMTMAALLERHPEADEDTIRRATVGNLCRCGAYPKIIRAGLRAARELADGKKNKHE